MDYGYVQLQYENISRKPENEFINSFEAALQKINSQAREFDSLNLRFANEDTSLLFLQTLIKFDVLISDKKFFALCFKKCHFDARFFEYLGRNFIDTKDLKLEFYGDCELHLNEKSHLEIVTNCFKNLGYLEISLYHDGTPERLVTNSSFWLEISRQAPAEALRTSLDEAAIFNAQMKTQISNVEDYKDILLQSAKGVPFISLKKSNRRWEISSVPLLLLILGLPAIYTVEVDLDIWSSTSEFIDRAMKEFYKRPVFAAPCKFMMKGKRTASSILECLENFNKLRMRSMLLELRKEDEAELEHIVKRAVEVLSQSVYIEEVHIDIPCSQQAMWLGFLEELRKLASRLPRVDLVIRFLELDDEVTDKLRELYSIIMRIRKNGFAGDYLNIMNLTATTVLDQRKIGSSCLLRMLPVDLIRELHRFIIDPIMHKEFVCM